MQHFAVGFVFDAFRQRSSLHCGAVQDAFNGGGIGFTAEDGADLLRYGSTGAGVLQAVWFRPLRADGRGKRFGGGFVVLRFANARAQRLQHFAVGFVFDALRQRGGLHRSAIEDAFDGRGIGVTTEGGADLLGDGSAGAGVLQTVLFLPLRADGGSKRFGSGFVALCSTNACAQRLQHFAVGLVFDALRQRGGLHGGTVQDAFNRGGISFTAEGGADLLRHGSTGVRVLQAVLFLPLRADGSSKRLGSGVVALCGSQSATESLQHRAVGFGADACGQGRRCGLLSGDFGGDAVENGFNGGGVGFACATEGGDDTLRDGVAGRFVLQAVVRL